MACQEKAEAALKRLIRGLMSESDKVALPAYRELYETGAVVVPLLERELQRIDLQKVSHRQTNAVVAGLASLLHDIDERASRAFIEKALQSECSPVIASTLRSIQRYSDSNYHEDMFSHVRIFEEKTIDEAHRATDRVKAWLSSVPAKDIDGLSRIYIISYESGRDFAGEYLPKLGVVTLAWYCKFSPSNPVNRLLHRRYKHTLLHEIGHHVHNHWFGQDPDQEEEADRYARSTLSSREPTWRRLMRKVFAIRN
jgi:hypothetical protein